MEEGWMRQPSSWLPSCGLKASVQRIASESKRTGQETQEEAKTEGEA